MKQIPLTQGKIALVGDRDYARVAKHKWYALRDKNGRRYARSNVPLPQSGGQRNIKMHRLILDLLEQPQVEVDHRNRDGLDNRRCNLRRANRKDNMGNRQRNCNNTSGVKGVTWHKAGGAWCAKIGRAGKRIHLGLFSTKQKAAAAYRHAAEQWFGEFART